jgi:hypothetical protein
MMLFIALLACLLIEEKMEPSDFVKDGEDVMLVTLMVSTPSMFSRFVFLVGGLPETCGLRLLVKVVAPGGKRGLGLIGGAVTAAAVRGAPGPGARTSERSFLGCKGHKTTRNETRAQQLLLSARCIEHSKTKLATLHVHERREGESFNRISHFIKHSLAKSIDYRIL